MEIDTRGPSLGWAVDASSYQVGEGRPLPLCHPIPQPGPAAPSPRNTQRAPRVKGGSDRIGRDPGSVMGLAVRTMRVIFSRAEVQGEVGRLGRRAWGAVLQHCAPLRMWREGGPGIQPPGHHFQTRRQDDCRPLVHRCPGHTPKAGTHTGQAPHSNGVQSFSSGLGINSRTWDRNTVTL